MKRTAGRMDYLNENILKWGWHFILICLLLILVFSISILDVYWITNSTIAILVIVFAKRSQSQNNESTEKSFVILLESKLRKSANPVVDFREAIREMNEKGRLTKSEIRSILTYFINQEGVYSQEAQNILDTSELD